MENIAPASSTPASQTTTISPDQNPAPDKNNATPTEGDSEPWRKVKHKYKAAGEIVEVDYDELVRKASLADGAEKRLYQASKKEKEILARLDSVKNAKSFDDIVDLLGGDDRALTLAEEYVWNKLQYEKLPPEKKEALAEKKRADQAEKELADLKAMDESRSKAERDSRASEIINREINDAISEAQKAGLSPEDVPEYVERMVEGMILHLEYLEECEAEGIPPSKSPPSPRDVLRKLRDRDSKKAQGFLKNLSAKDLKQMLSAEQLEALRAAEIDGLYSSTPMRTKQEPKTNEKPVDPFEEKTAAKRSKPSTDEWFKAMEKRYNGR